MHPPATGRSTLWLAAAVLVLQGCATQHRHEGQHAVEEALAAQGLEATAVVGQPLPLPDKPLGVAEIVRLALSNSPEVQREYIALAVGADEVYTAPPWPVPVFSGEWLDPKFPGTTQRTFGIAVAVGDLITWPARRRVSRQHYAALQARVAAAVLDAAGATAAAYYEYAAATQAHLLQRHVTRTALLRAELAERFRAAGNLEPREFAEYRAAAARARLEELEAAEAAGTARAALASMIGVSLLEDWQIDARLALPEKDIPQPRGLVELARTTRLDLEAARIEFDSAVTEAGAIPWLSWLGNIEVGYIREKDVDESVKRGPSLEIGLPRAGHHGDPAVEQAELEFLRLYTDVENSVALAAQRVDTGRARIEIYLNEFLPRQGEVTDATLAQYNFMLTGAFDLLAQKLEQFDAYAGYIDALRDYWLARVELDRALGVAPAREFTDAAWFDIAAVIGAAGAAPAGMDHSMHEGMDHSMHENMDMGGPRSNEPHDHGGKR